MMKKLMLLGLTSVLLLTGSLAQADGTYMIIPGLPGYFFPGYITSSADGSVLGGSWGGLFLYTDGGGVAYIDNPNGAAGGSISGNGLALTADFADPDGFGHAGYWNATDGFVLVDPIPGGAPCGSDLSSSYALNFDGSVLVGLHWVGCDAVAFKWTAGAGAVNLGSSGNSSRATGVSADGTTTVGFDEHPVQGYRRPAIWTDNVSGPQLIAGEDAGGECYDVSSDGSMVCGELNGVAMYWDANVGAVELGTLPGDEFDGSLALAISDDGKVVGFSGSPFFGTPRAFIWTVADGMMALSDYLVQEGVAGYEGDLLDRAIDISADGNTIVGAVVPAGGFLKQAFVVRLSGPVSNEDHGQNPGTNPVPTFATALQGAYPNPFNPMTTVRFSLARDQHVSLAVYDATGRLVAQLADDMFAAGEHPIVWNGTDAAGRGVPSGTYLFQMQTEEGLRTSKALLVR
jgi:uncharacterized membrane protein